MGLFLCQPQSSEIVPGFVADSSEATGLKWATPAGGGKVLQVVQATYSTTTTVASTTFTDSGLSASITPSSASSKVLILVSQLSKFGGDTDNSGMSLKILRGSTDVYAPGGSAGEIRRAFFANASTLNTPKGITLQEVFNMHYLDSPSTTSSTTYKTQQAVLSTASSGFCTTQAGDGTSTIILMEIGA